MTTANEQLPHRPLSVLLILFCASFLASCLEPNWMLASQSAEGGYSDSPANDEDAGSSDDDDAQDDDDAGSDDDDAGGNDDDDATASHEETSLAFLSPSSTQPLSGETLAVVQASGVSSGTVLWYLADELLGSSTLSSPTLQAQYLVDTHLQPNGSYELRAELDSPDVEALIEVTIANTDLLVLELPTVINDTDPEGYVNFSFDVPEDSIGLQLQLGADPSAAVTFLWSSMLNPTGDWAVDFEGALYTVDYSGRAPYAGGIPNHPNAPWLTGTYTAYPFAAGPDADGLELSPTVLIKQWSGEPEAGVLDIDFYFVPGLGLTSVTAPNSPDFSDFTDALDSVLGGADISLGELRYFDVSGGSYNDISGAAEIYELLAESNLGSERRLNVFLIDEFDVPNVTLFGYASHIPGPALASGTPQSGVILTSAFIEDGDAWSAAALAGHEISHYLGLRHTSEEGGVVHDPLLDTSISCSASTCWSTNLMDPSGFENYSLTEDQRYVLLRHPLVQLVSSGEEEARSVLATPPAGWTPAPELSEHSCGNSIEL